MEGCPCLSSLCYTNEMKSILYFLCFAIFLVSCTSGNDPGKNYQIPRFAVYPPSHSGLPGGGTFASLFQSKPSRAFTLFPAAYAQEHECDKELSFYNDAQSRIISGQAASISGKDFIHSFYAQAILYDCETRRQARAEGVGATSQNHGEEGTVILTVSLIDNRPEDWTRYISWTDLPESANVRGKLINKYLQKDGARTKTRVDLAMKNGARTVKSMLLYTDEYYTAYTSANFKESSPDTKGNFQVQEIWGRYYDDSANKIVQARALVRVGEGFAVELVRCDISGTNIDTDCSGSSDKVVEHYDANGTKLNSARSGWTFGSDTGDSFYSGELESEFFAPKFSI